MRNRLISVLFVVFAASQVTACSGRATLLGNGPDFEMTGNVQGIRAFYDGNVGQLKTSKEAGDAVNQHMQFRAEQEREVTKRETAPGFLSNLFGQGAPKGMPSVQSGS